MAINLTADDSLSLPPQVIGKIRGVLIFKISEIVLYRAPTAVLVQLQWWGENTTHSAGPIKIQKKETKKTIKPANLVYDICTSLNLFYSYLSQCEPIKAEIFTAISYLKLGTAQIEIPQVLYQTKSPQSQASSTCTITNDEGNCVGEIHINIQIKYENNNSDSNRKKSYDVLVPEIQQETKHNKVLFDNNGKKYLEKCIKSPRKLINNNKNDDVDSICSKTSTDLAISCRENVLKFLHGEDMSIDLEKQALKDIRNLSPASSLIALADAEHCLTKNTSWTHCPSNIDSKIESISFNTQKDSSISKYIDQISKITGLQKHYAMESNTVPKLVIPESHVKTKTTIIDRLISHVDSVRVTVQTLTLTRAGLRIVLGLENLPLVTISSQVTFFIEYAMPSLTKQQENSSNLSRIRICAKSKDGQDVPFNRQSVHKVPLSAIMTNVTNPAILFNVYYRKLSQRQAKHLGQCRITLNEIISTPKLHSTRKCPIITSQNDKGARDDNKKNTDSNHKIPEKLESDNVFSDVIGFGGILAGHLTVKVELGSGLLHFGKHFLESFAANQENISIPSTVTNNLSNEEFVASTTYNGQVLENCNQTMNHINKQNFSTIKHQQVMQLQDRCTVCKDFYANKPNLQKPQYMYESNNPKAMRRYDNERVSHQELKNFVTRKVANKQSQSMKIPGFGVDQGLSKERKKQGIELVTDSDDGKFVNTDLRGGKDIICEKDQSDKKNLLTKKSFSKKSNYFRKDRGKVADADIDSHNDEESTLLHGLLFVNEARGLEPQLLPQAYCLVNRGLCPGTGGSSKPIMCDGKYFQYLETFPLLCNQALMERCHSGHLIIEIWLKGSGPAQKLVGVASLPLHAFFVAYHDPNMVRYLEKVKLPVISVDGWIPLLSPISGTVSGEIQALLAVGTEKQLEELRISRNLKPDIVQMLDDSPNANHQKHHQKSNKKSAKHEKRQAKVLSCSIGVNTSPIVVRQFATSISDINSVFPGSQDRKNLDEETNQKIYNTVHTQTTNEAEMPTVLEETEEPLVSARSSNAIPLKKPKSFGNLSAFVSQLMQNIPQDAAFLSNFQLGLCSEKSSADAAPRLKQTSDLLEELQRALEHVPQNRTDVSDETVNTSKINEGRISDNIALNNAQVNNTINGTETSVEEVQSCENIECFKAMIEIEQALRLAMISTTTKKCNKRSKCKSRIKTIEVAPSTYVTFPAMTCNSSGVVQAPEGPVVATNVVPNTCNPVWKQRFEVSLPVDLLKTDPKQLVFKIWRKSNSATNVASNPSPISDVVIGFAVVDLSILLTGLPSICGWFNISDIAHRCSGQIKISITPLEDLDKYINETSYCCSDNDTIHSINSVNEDKLTLNRLSKSKEKMMEMLEEAKAKLYGIDSSERMETNESNRSNLVETNANIEQEGNINQDVNSNHENGQIQFTNSSNLNSMQMQHHNCVSPPNKSVNLPYESVYHHNQQNVMPNMYSNYYNNSMNQQNNVQNSDDGVVAMNHSIITDILNQNPNKCDIDDETLNTSSLSRVLKRKFTELHEITQRLRSRLLDVTQDDDDEFERDLNTISDEKAYDIRPEDFVSLARIVSNASPNLETLEEEKSFENLANDYQNKLAEKTSSDCKDDEDIDSVKKELALSRDILTQRKCNINSLLQKLTLLSNTNETACPPVEKHVKFNSDIEVHDNDSGNIFELISGTEFNSGLQNSVAICEESSIDSEGTSKSGSYQCKSPEELENIDRFEINSENLGLFQGKSHFKYPSEQISESGMHDASFPRATSTSILKHGSFERRNDGLINPTLSPEISSSIPETSDEEDESNSRAIDVDVRDVITNILKITERCPSISKDTGLEEDDTSSKRSNSSVEQGEKKDLDTTGIYSDFCDS